MIQDGRKWLTLRHEQEGEKTAFKRHLLVAVVDTGALVVAGEGAAALLLVERPSVSSQTESYSGREAHRMECACSCRDSARSDVYCD